MFFRYKSAFLFTSLYLLLLTGCGGGNADISSPDEYLVKVFASNPIKNSIIVAKECVSYEELDAGVYVLKSCTSKPQIIKAKGGFIDLNEDGFQNDNEQFFENILSLNTSQSNNYLINPLTTLATDLSEENINKLANSLSIQKNDIYKKAKINETNLQDIFNAILLTFIDTKRLGVDEENFNKDFFNALTQSSNAQKSLEKIKNAQINIKENANSIDFRKKYGMSLLGYKENDFTKSPRILLEEYGTINHLLDDELIFQGYSYDEVLSGSTIKVYKVDSLGNHELPELTETIADENGKWSIKLNKSILSLNQNIVFESETTIKNKDDKDINIKLNSIISSKVLNSLNVKDINLSNLFDISITSVSTAKLSYLKSISPLVLGDVQKLYDEKLKIQNDSDLKEQIITTSVVLKNTIENKILLPEGVINTSIYGDNIVNEIKDVQNFKSHIVSNYDISSDDYDKQKNKIIIDKVLNSQLDTKVYKSFLFSKTELNSKKISFVKHDDQTFNKLYLFESGKYIKESNDGKNEKQNIGLWSIDNDKYLSLNNSFKLYFSSLNISSKGRTDDKDELSFVNITNFSNKIEPILNFTPEFMSQNIFYLFDSENNEVVTKSFPSADLENGNIINDGKRYKVFNSFPKKLLFVSEGSLNDKIELFYKKEDANISFLKFKISNNIENIEFVETLDEFPSTTKWQKFINENIENVVAYKKQNDTEKYSLISYSNIDNKSRARLFYYTQDDESKPIGFSSTVKIVDQSTFDVNFNAMNQISYKLINERNEEAYLFIQIILRYDKVYILSHLEEKGKIYKTYVTNNDDNIFYKKDKFTNIIGKDFNISSFISNDKKLHILVNDEYKTFDINKFDLKDYNFDNRAVRYEFRTSVLNPTTDLKEIKSSISSLNAIKSFE